MIKKIPNNTLQVPVGNLTLTHSTFTVLIPSDETNVTTEFTLRNVPGLLPPPTAVFYRPNLIHPDSSVYGIAVPAPGLSDQDPTNQAVQIQATFGIEDVGSHLSRVEVFNMLSNKEVILSEPLSKVPALVFLNFL